LSEGYLYISRGYWLEYAGLMLFVLANSSSLFLLENKKPALAGFVFLSFSECLNFVSVIASVVSAVTVKVQAVMSQFNIMAFSDIILALLNHVIRKLDNLVTG
jgi:hypothetical protein